MIKLALIGLGLLTATNALAEEDWQATMRRGAQAMDDRNAAFDQRIHDMNMESEAHRQSIEQFNSNVTQEGILDQMRQNDVRRGYRW